MVTVKLESVHAVMAKLAVDERTWRKELGKLAKKMAEECKIAVRNIRREANDALKKLEKDKKISEDDLHRATEDVQKSTNEKVEQVDQIMEAKQKEILET